VLAGIAPAARLTLTVLGAPMAHAAEASIIPRSLGQRVRRRLADAPAGRGTLTAWA
jgi:hypothetical protein